MRTFFQTLPKNILNSFTGKNIFFHLLAIVATVCIVISGFDWQYFISVRNQTLNQLFFPALIIGGLLPIILPIWLIVLGRARHNVRLRVVGWALAQAAIIGSVISSAYKIFTGRVQPNVADLIHDSSHGFQFGFLNHGIFWGWPSSHTTIAFAMSVTLIVLFPKNRRVLFFSLLYAFYIAIGVSLSIHWFSEVIAGGLIGTALGLTVGKAFAYTYGMKSKITFKNKPKLSGHEADKKYDDRRLMLVPHIEHFLSTDELFRGKDVSVEFSYSGVSSLLSFIESDGEKYVLKIPLNAIPVEGEAEFLKAWESIGVATPHVFREGTIADRPYILMAYIDAPLLLDAIIQDSEKGSAKNDISVEIGKTLRMMHIPKAEGYGRVLAGKPQHATFEDWIASADIQKRIRTVQEHTLLADEHGPIAKVLDILNAYATKNPTSTYCHFDFGASNILDTEPLTVIDPDPMINNGIIDIGRSMLLAVSGGFPEAAEQLKEGYFGKNSFDTQALQAAMILNAYMKFPYWHKKNKTEQIERIQQYFIQTKQLLD